MKVVTLGTSAKEEIESKVALVKEICECKGDINKFNDFLENYEESDKNSLVDLYEFINRTFKTQDLREEDYLFLTSILNEGLTECILSEKARIVASAGSISRSSGTVTEVYNKRNDLKKNIKYASTVIGYGHKTIAEHDYIVLALENVTPIVEQTIIEYRLTSFTIKSRRNVDFRNVGFYVPEFKDKNGNILENNEELQTIYKNYMKSLFDKYGNFVDEGLPVEDCRYILPYSYYSNIIMGCDANELLRIASDLLYGKLSKIDELKEFGSKLKNIIRENAPYLLEELDKEKSKNYYEDKFKFLDGKINSNDAELIKKPHLTYFTQSADKIVLCNILMSRYQFSRKKAEEMYEKLLKEDATIGEQMIQALIRSKNQRELEQVIFSFETPISLAVLTHITRHRMHSLLVPDFVPLWNMKNYITPNTIAVNHKNEYEEIFDKNNLMVQSFKKHGVREEDLVYFYLSGNACNIYTTMNGKALVWFSRMRCCNKAQWEMKNIADTFAKDVKSVEPLIGKCIGATCEVLDYCPEGKDSCKNRGVVTKKLVK